MSIKKTSILALSVLLSYESFAAPTVLATTPRLGASSSVASTGRGKATTSVSIGGGLNKLTSNRGQSSFTPNSAPTDKQNELIENFQKEIQNVRDAVAEELQAQNDKIRELESVIEEKDEKIAELEESIDEKIESKGFVTAESVTSEISTAKQEAVRQATNAAVKEVNSMGFAKTATVQSEISTAKNAAIAQAKTEAVAEVNGMGFAKTATVQSDILTATNAAIDAALAEVESKGFATNVSVQNLKAEITTERNEALQSYATSAQLAEDIDAAKSEITTARNTALQSYATSAQLAEDIDAAKTDAITTANNAITTAIAAESAARSAIVATLATKEELQNLEVGVDESTVAGIVDEVLDTKKVISENTPAFQDVQQQVAAMPTTYAKSSALTDLDTRVKQNTQDIAKADTAIKAEATTRTEIVATLATKEELQSLEVGVDEERLAGIIDGKLQAGGFATATALTSLDTRVKQNTQDIANALSDITEEKGKIANLDARLAPGFVTPADLTTYKGEVEAVLQDYATTASVESRFNDISDTIADDLLADTTFKEGVLEGLSTELTELPSRVTALDNAVKDLGNTYATNEALNRVEGRFAGYVEKDDVNNRFSALDGIYVKPATLGTALKDVDLSSNTTIKGLGNTYATKASLEELGKPQKLEELLGNIYVKPATLDNRITGLSATYATNEALNRVDGKFASYVEIDDVNNRFTALDGIYVKPATLGTALKDVDLSSNTTIRGLGNTYATKASLENLQNAKTLANYLGDTYVTPEKFDTELSANSKFKDLNNTVSSFGDTYATQASVNALVSKVPANVIGEMQNSKSDYYIGNWVDDNKQPIIITQATLGTGIDNLLDNKETRLYKIETGVSSLETNVSSLNTDLNNLNSKAVTTSTFATELGKNNVVTTGNMAEKGVVTTGNFADKLTANSVVTTNNLASKLYTELTGTKNKDGTCQEPTGDKAALIDLFIEGNVGECSTSGN